MSNSTTKSKSSRLNSGTIGRRACMISRCHCAAANGDQVELGCAAYQDRKGLAGLLFPYTEIRQWRHDVRRRSVLLLDLKNPRRIIGRTRGSIMAPEAFYEKVGMVPNIIFPSGAIIGAPAKKRRRTVLWRRRHAVRHRPHSPFKPAPCPFIRKAGRKPDHQPL